MDVTERARLGEIELAWEDEGDKDAPVLLLLHGFTGHRDDFLEVRADLAVTRRVIIPDLRGHGDSGGVADLSRYSFDVLLDDTVRLLDQLGSERVDLLGHSLGGMLALRFALVHPERLRTLTLMSTSSERPEGMSGERLERAIAIALEQGMATLQARSERAGRRTAGRIIERWGERYWRHHARRHLAMNPYAYAGIGRSMIGQEPVTARLDEIVCPTLVLVGAHDVPFLAASKRLGSQIPGARLVIFEEAGHHPHQESREAFLRAMAEHLGAR